MENKGLLFIPDISGFTRFINATEIEHCRLIIQELLEILIDANELGLKVSEIEGDAILFYKYGESPELEALYQQVEKMFCSFHKHLVAYDYTKYCQCKACKSAIDLTLKVITHYGEFASYNVKNFQKLIGKDVIVAHQLLKNDIERHEYWLITNSLLEQPVQLEEWMNWEISTIQMEGGELIYHYTQLTPLKKEITVEPMPAPDFSNKVKTLSVSREYDTSIITLFHAAGDFNYRSQWLEGVKAVEEVNHFLPRVGMKCRCILENGQSFIYSTSYSYQDDRIEFTEMDEENNLSHYILESLADNKTRLSIDLYMDHASPAETVPDKNNEPLLEKYERSLENLVDVVKGIPLPGNQ